MSQNKANPSQRDTNVWLKAECGSVSGGFENNYTYSNDIMWALTLWALIRVAP